MNIKLIYLILILTLNFSCVEERAFEKEKSKSELGSSTKSDTLKFTSGIRAIFQDSKGNYWLGSHSEGVSYFNGKSFEYFTTKEGLSDNQVRSIQEDENGNIWLGTANGVSSYDGEKITNYNQLVKANSQSEWIKTEDDLWLSAGETGGVYRINDQILNYLELPIPKEKSVNSSFGVTGISKGVDGKIWIATYSALFSFDGKVVKVFDKSKLELKEDELLHIRSVFADSQGRIWIGNNGIGVLLLQENSTINFSDKNGLIHPESTKNGSTSPEGTLEHVFVIEEDGEGNIWFGDRDTGAWKYDGESMTNYTIDGKLKSQMILNIYEDQNKNLLYGMANGGVYQFNGKSFERRF